MARTEAQVTGVLETALYVRDLERTAQFYTDTFGFPVIFEEPKRLIALGVGGRQVLLLFAQGGSAKGAIVPGGRIPAHDGSGNLHVAFSIDGDRLEAWEARLAELGIPVESRVTWPRGGTSLYLRDPEGHSVELATPGVWSLY